VPRSPTAWVRGAGNPCRPVLRTEASTGTTINRSGTDINFESPKHQGEGNYLNYGGIFLETSGMQVSYGRSLHSIRCSVPEHVATSKPRLRALAADHSFFFGSVVYW
jgi:hypothetical protein